MAFKYTPSPFMLPTSHYDKKKADRAVTFIQNLCHTKGKWAGQKFLLLPWQEQIVRHTRGVDDDVFVVEVNFIPAAHRRG